MELRNLNDNDEALNEIKTNENNKKNNSNKIQKNEKRQRRDSKKKKNKFIASEVHEFLKRIEINDNKLTKLDLSNNDLTVITTTELLKALSSNTHLKKLDISYNPRIGSIAMIQFINALSNYPKLHLKFLDLSYTGNDEQSINTIHDWIQNNLKLHHFHIREHKVVPAKLDIGIPGLHLLKARSPVSKQIEKQIRFFIKQNVAFQKFRHGASNELILTSRQLKDEQIEFRDEYLARATIVNFENNLLSHFPSKLDKFLSITQLNLSNNNITVISDHLRYLKTLGLLNLSNNQITEIPLDLFKELLTHRQLTNIYFSGNPIRNLNSQYQIIENSSQLNEFNKFLGNE
eukprot:TRINITY_DN392_c3_g1_i1.p1 TRINITY_DN392_c3_g1~~TRINITY_DN392_c3_g1_i1.p1  ORF type:complete len:346 (-),score=148.85 TRINITY_DN392_c3_g1_i1:66-1103(-)